jgi:hypothetical protein
MRDSVCDDGVQCTNFREVGENLIIVVDEMSV